MGDKIGIDIWSMASNLICHVLEADQRKGVCRTETTGRGRIHDTILQHLDICPEIRLSVHLLVNIQTLPADRIATDASTSLYSTGEAGRVRE